MKKINTSPLSGMQELLPSAQAVFNTLKRNIEKVYHLHGYQNIETPLIDRTEILLAKAGGDTEKQIYFVQKTLEESAGIKSEENAAIIPDQALRFDHTVPLARYVAAHERELAFPFKVSQIGRNFRGERAQAGRFREFYQLDVDIIGRGSLPIAYDADAIATVYVALKTFDLPDMKIRISNRKILSGFISALGLSENSAEIMNIIDHAEKVPEEKTTESLRALGLPEESVVKITTFIHIKGDRQEVMSKLDEFHIEDPTFQTGTAELAAVLDLLAARGLEQYAIADLMIVRGLDYYTGTVVETFLPDYREIGSIASGGRYENLAHNFSDQTFPGVGVSIGLTRLFYVLTKHNLLKTTSSAPIDVALIPISEREYSATFDLSARLQAAAYSTDIIMTDKPLGDKLSHAAKIAKNAVVIGENETKSGNFLVKNLETGALTPLDDFLK
jgi:histidyl-tRNA synthetase